MLLVTSKACTAAARADKVGRMDANLPMGVRVRYSKSRTSAIVV